MSPKPFNFRCLWICLIHVFKQPKLSQLWEKIHLTTLAHSTRLFDQWVFRVVKQQPRPQQREPLPEQYGPLKLLSSQPTTTPYLIVTSVTSRPCRKRIHNTWTNFTIVSENIIWFCLWTQQSLCHCHNVQVYNISANLFWRPTTFPCSSFRKLEKKSSRHVFVPGVKLFIDLDAFMLCWRCQQMFFAQIAHICTVHTQMDNYAKEQHKLLNVGTLYQRLEIHFFLWSIAQT